RAAQFARLHPPSHAVFAIVIRLRNPRDVWVLQLRDVWRDLLHRAAGDRPRVALAPLDQDALLFLALRRVRHRGGRALRWLATGDGPRTVATTVGKRHGLHLSIRHHH